MTVDGRWRREYFRDEDGLIAWIAEALPAVHSARGSDSPSGVAASRSRRRKGL